MTLDNFVIYPSCAESIAKLPPDLRLEVYDALMIFGTTNEIPKGLSPVAEAMLTALAPGIEFAKKRRKENKEDGARGGAPLGNQNAAKAKNNRKQPETTENNLNVNVNADVNVKEEITNSTKMCVSTGTKARTQVFKPPELSEVEKYCREERNNNGINPQSFLDYYAARGWLVSGAPVKDWRKLIHRWEERKYTTDGGQPPKPPPRHDPFGDVLKNSIQEDTT